MAKLNLMVLYTERLDACRRFYASLGLLLQVEQHGAGPEHYAAVLAGGTVLELYPGRGEQATGPVRLGFAVRIGETDLLLAVGRHLLKDPDGRTVEVLVEGAD